MVKAVQEHSVDGLSIIYIHSVAYVRLEVISPGNSGDGILLKIKCQTPHHPAY